MTGSQQSSASPPGWSNDAFREAEPSGVRAMHRGLVGHVPVVAILLIIQGILEIAFGLFALGFLLVVHYGPEKELGSMRGFSYVMAGAGALAAAIGLIRVLGGIFNLRYRRRGLGLVALSGGLLTLVTGYCAPSAIALAIYGLIVYVNEPVIAAFQLGDSGRSTAEIDRAFPSQA